MAALCAMLALVTGLRAAEPAVVPRPASLQADGGDVAVAAVVTPAGDAGAHRAAGRFADLVRRTHAIRLRTAPGAATKAIRFERISDPRLGDEAYRVVVDANGARVIARTDAGLQLGATTLWQLSSAREGVLHLPTLRIEDAPRFPWRGLMLDSARHYQSPAFIHQLLDAMAAHKLNVLHWHLTDDQGWRVEIRKYPRLTQVGAWRVPAGAAAAADIDPLTRKPRLQGGFYSRAAIRALVRHAGELGITVVPEIDLPGHASAAIAAYPRLAAIDDPSRTVPSDWGIYPNVLNLDEATFGFVQDVLDEVLALFPSRFIHVGGDEVIRDQWSATARGRARLHALGIDDPKRIQPYFTQRIGRYLHAHGRRLVGWDEILEPGLDSDAVVMSWRGTSGAERASHEGFDTVVAAHPTLYFDNRQGNGDAEPPGRVKVVSLADVYAFEPQPADADAAAAKHVLGVQANVWTEHIRTEERVAVMTFPRAAALAEIGWTAPARRDWSAFVERLDALMQRYPAIGLAAAARQEQERRQPQALDPWKRSSRQLELCSQDIALGLEDDAPVAGPRAVFDLDIQDPCWWWRGVDMGRVGALRARVGQVPFNFQIGAAVDKIRFAESTAGGPELQVRVDRCDGPPAAVIPLASATSPALTTLPDVVLPRLAGSHDLCLRFAQEKVDPLWAVDAVQLLERRP